MNSYENYIGKRYTWDEAKELFPDKWVAFSDYELNGSVVKSGIIQAVCDDSEMSKEAIRLKENHCSVIWDRTTKVLFELYVQS